MGERRGRAGRGERSDGGMREEGREGRKRGSEGEGRGAKKEEREEGRKGWTNRIRRDKGEKEEGYGSREEKDTERRKFIIICYYDLFCISFKDFLGELYYNTAK